MIKKTLFGLSALLLLTACGGSSSNSKTKTDTDKLKERERVLISYSYPSDICKSDELLNEIKAIADTKNHLIVVESNEASEYNKTEIRIPRFVQVVLHFGLLWGRLIPLILQE